MGGNVVRALDMEGRRKPHRGVIATGGASRLQRGGCTESRAPSLVIIEAESCPALQFEVAANFSLTGSRLSGSSGSPFARTS
jgi:hypothetical protein